MALPAAVRRTAWRRGAAMLGAVTGRRTAALATAAAPPSTATSPASADADTDSGARTELHEWARRPRRGGAPPPLRPTPPPSATVVPYLAADKAVVPGQRVYFEAYGCQMNTSDTEIVWALMKQAGYERTDTADDADVVFLVTCAVRDNAEKKIWARLSALAATKVPYSRGRKRRASADTHRVTVVLTAVTAGALSYRLEPARALSAAEGPGCGSASLAAWQSASRRSCSKPTSSWTWSAGPTLYGKLPPSLAPHPLTWEPPLPLHATDTVAPTLIAPSSAHAPRHHACQYRDLPRLLAQVEDSGQPGVNVMLSLEETYADVTPVRLNVDSTRCARRARGARLAALGSARWLISSLFVNWPKRAGPTAACEGGCCQCVCVGDAWVRQHVLLLHRALHARP